MSQYALNICSTPSVSFILTLISQILHRGRYDWGFSAAAQLFANHGYIVLEVNPRY